MTYIFSGKVVLITGGTGALGRAVAQAFGTSNATTVVSYIIDEEREDVKAKIKTIAELVKADITKEDHTKKLVLHVINTYDRIDVLVNVVGGYLGGKPVAELDETE
jgi:NAD(P)-dependent dehydrogenase (short-subunit alcohol dehydrogenase family)